MNVQNALKWIAQYNKSIAGFAVAGVIKYLQVKSSGVTSDEWQDILIAALVGGGLVWLVPNRPKQPEDK